MSDPDLDNLQDKGLLLSKPIDFVLPIPMPPQSSLYSAIFSNRGVKLGNFNHITSLNILDHYLVIGRANTLLLYRYIAKDNSDFKVNQLSIQHSGAIITQMKSCNKKFSALSNSIPVLLLSEDGILYYSLETKSQKLIYRGQYSSKNILAFHLISDQQAVILTAKLQLVVLSLADNRIRLKFKPISLAKNINNDPSQRIMCIKFAGNVKQGQDSIISLFYSKQTPKAVEKLYIQQFQRTFEGQYSVLTNFKVTQVQKTLKTIFQTFQLQEYQDFFLVATYKSLLIIKKKFQNYHIMQQLIQKNSQNKLVFSTNCLICDLSAKTFELSLIKFGDPTSTHRILDEIQIPDSTLWEKYISHWTYVQDKNTRIAFLFKTTRGFQIYSVVKVDPMIKMWNLVQDYQQNFKKNDKKQKKVNLLPVFQDQARNLGVSKKDFYLYCWKKSTNELHHIEQYLLPCQDIYSIKYELESWLRRKKITVFKLNIIFDKISKMLQKQMIQNLSESLLKQYLKIEFLKLKLKLSQNHTEVQIYYFNKIYCESILDICVEIAQSQIDKKEEKKIALHSMDKPVEKEKIQLKLVFQTFKLLILENYIDKFLPQFFDQFKGKIARLLKQYPFLVPKHPFVMEFNEIKDDQFNAKKQQEKKDADTTIMQDHYANLSYINDLTTFVKKEADNNPELLRQPFHFKVISNYDFYEEKNQQSIQKYLQKYYQAHQIRNVINNFANSSYGKLNKFRRHGLINCTFKEYQEKIKNLSGMKIFYKICEYANDYAIAHNTISEIQQILKIYHDKALLVDEDFRKCQIYSRMHLYFKKNAMIENFKNLTIEQLVEMGQHPENIISLFFLGNRNKKDQLFNGFYLLFDDKADFLKMFKQFVDSENCSFVELSLILKEFRQTKSQAFQEDNQDVIEVMMNGFCKKIYIRERDSHLIDQFVKIFQTLHQGYKVATKFIQIIHAQAHQFIFDQFNLSDLTYFEILQDWKRTLTKFMEHYFEGNIKDNKDTIVIEDVQFNMQQSRSMLNILLYVQQKIFETVPQSDVLMLYCQQLVMWKQFQVLKILIYEQQLPFQEPFRKQKRQFLNQLMGNCLLEIYKDSNILYDQQTKSQIQCIIGLDDQNSAIKIREKAKLALTDIFEDWKYQVHPVDINNLIIDWSQEYVQNRIRLLEALIDQQIENMTFYRLVEIYRLFESASKEIQDIQITDNPEILVYAIIFCKKIYNLQRYEEVIEIIGYIICNGGERAAIQYLKNNSISQQIKVTIKKQIKVDSFLHQIARLYSQDMDIAKRYVDFYINHEQYESKLALIYNSKLGLQALIENQVFRNFAMFDSHYNLPKAKRQKFQIQLQDLWHIIASIENISNVDIIYHYYLFQNAINNYEQGLTLLTKMPYNFDIILRIIADLQKFIDERPNMLGLDVFQFYRTFELGIYRVAIYRLDTGAQEEKKQYEDFMINDKTSLEIIKNNLKKTRDKNEDILKVISKLDQSIIHKIKINRKKRQQKYQEKLDQEALQKKQREQETSRIQEMKQDQDEPLNRTYVFKDLKDVSGFITHKDLHLVFHDPNQSKLQSKRNPKSKNSTFLTPKKFLTRELTQDRQLDRVMREIENQRYNVAKTFPKQLLLRASKAIFQKQETSFSDCIRLLDNLQIIDPKKVDPCKLVQIFSKEILSSQHQKQIFSFEFLTRKLEYDVQRNPYDIIFEDLEADLSKLLFSKNYQEIFAIGQLMSSILENQRFSKLVTLMALKQISSAQNNAQTVLKINQLLKELSKDQYFLSIYILELKNQYKKNPDLYQVLRHYIMDMKNIPNQIRNLF